MKEITDQRYNQMCQVTQSVKDKRGRKKKGKASYQGMKIRREFFLWEKIVF